MGLPMSINLRNALPESSHLYIYDRLPALKSKFGAGVTVIQGPEHVAEMVAKNQHTVDCVISMLPDSKHVEELYADLQLPRHSATRTLIDCSTIDPARSRKLAELCKAQNLGDFVDAPVSGGVSGATNGTLSFMIGQPADNSPLSQELTRVLSMMGKTLHFCGDRGSGLVAKLVNNYLLALNNLATCEAMHLGLNAGIDATVLGQVINSSTGKCWPSEKNNPVLGISPGAPVERDFDGGFGIELMLKDLGLAIQMAKTAGVSLGSGDAALEVYRDAAKAFRSKDFGVVLKYLEQSRQ